MIHIDKGQEVLGNPNLKVVTPSGDYEDVALIECASKDGPDTVAGAFHAQYVKYGNLVYQHSDPQELGREILKIDPKSTHTAAAFVRMTDELLGKMSDGALEPDSLDKAVATEQAGMEERMTDPIDEELQDIEQDLQDLKREEDELKSQYPAPVDTGTTTPPVADTSSSTPAVQGGSGTQTGSSTPAVSFPDNAGTSTPPVVETSTTTPSVPAASSASSTPAAVPADNASTTSDIVAYAKRRIAKKINKRLRG